MKTKTKNTSVDNSKKKKGQLFFTSSRKINALQKYVSYQPLLCAPDQSGLNPRRAITGGIGGVDGEEGQIAGIDGEGRAAKGEGNRGVSGAGHGETALTAGFSPGMAAWMAVASRAGAMMTVPYQYLRWRYAI